MRALAPGPCALLLVSCADGAPPPGTWTVETGSAPTLLVLTDDDVYATSLGRGGAQVHRVGRSTGRQAARRNGWAVYPDDDARARLQRLAHPTRSSRSGRRSSSAQRARAWR